MKVTASLFASEARDDGTAPVYLTVRHAGKRALLPLAPYGVPNVKPKDWNAKRGSVRKTTDHWEGIGARIAEAVALAERLHVERVVPSAAALRDAMRAELDRRYRPDVEPEPEAAPAGFLAFCRDQVAGYLARGQVGTHDQYRAICDKLEDYLERPTLAYEDVTPALVRGFYAWLLAPEPAGRGNRPNTARKAITTMRTFWTRAHREGLTGPAPSPEPWHAVTPKSEKARKRKLSVGELEAFLTGELPRGATSTWRDVFAFAFYCGGARFGDVCWMRRGDLRGDDVVGWRAAWRQEKTTDLHAVALAPAALAVLDRLRPGWREMDSNALLLPALDDQIARLGREPATPREADNVKRKANAVANKHLRRAAERLDVPPVSTHLARHSLAGYLLERGADVRTIQRVLGHSSVTQTETYLRGFDTAVADSITRGISFD